MSMDLTGIINVNEYYTNHYLAESFESNAAEAISAWRDASTGTELATPWSSLKSVARKYYVVHNRFERSRFDNQTLISIKNMADAYLKALGYPEAEPKIVSISDGIDVPVYLELKKHNGAPELWVLLATSKIKAEDILSKKCFAGNDYENEQGAVSEQELTDLENEKLVNKIFFELQEPPRFIILIGMNQIALLDRNKWNEKRYLQFELQEIFSRREESTLKAMSVLLHRDSLCPDEGKALIDELDEISQRNAAAVSDDLKYSLRECIERLGNEVLYDMKTRQGIDLEKQPVDPGQLTIECLRYMYRMLFLLFIESRTELGYAPIKDPIYMSGYSLESLRDIADNINDEIEEVGEGYYLHETLAKLYDLIYNGYPNKDEDLKQYGDAETKHAYFTIEPLKAHIFDPEYTKLITNAKIRNSVMLRIIKLMSLTRPNGRTRRSRISYANLGINQMGSVYEALLSYRGFVAEQDLFEVQKAGTKFNELEVGYFVTAKELEQYTEDERVYYTDENGRKRLRTYHKGDFIYRLAGREREKSASYYTPECLTKCLVKYALKELLKDKTADEILHLTVCEPAMGSAAFLNEAINQLAEAYLNKKQEETGVFIEAAKRFEELQKVKMFIADRNVYGIDLNPTAVELAEVSLWLNTIYKGGYVPWFGTQLVNGNSLIGARKQCYTTDDLRTTSAGMRWYEKAPERVPLQGGKRKPRKQVYHFLLGDTGMANYTDKVIKSLEPESIKKMKDWNKQFTKPYSEDDIATLLRLSTVIDDLWKEQVENRNELEANTQDKLSVYGFDDSIKSSHTSIRQKDKILHEIYKSEHQRNAGAYARLKFAMDYWCALWFWPIDKADLLPNRSEFLFDMSLILEGTVASFAAASSFNQGEISLFTSDELKEAGYISDAEQLVLNFTSSYSKDTVVDLPMLCQTNERLELVRQIAEQSRFMHWELEFADLFAERGGFDLVVGNPPWIKITWEEKGVLSDKNPMFAVRKLNATQTTTQRNSALEKVETKKAYFEEYAFMTGEQNFLNAVTNYELLKGQQTNLYKCFLPLAMYYAGPKGVFAYVHPDGIFNDPAGVVLRENLYPRLKYCFQYMNMLNLFADVHTNVTFYTNIYSNRLSKEFEMIANIYAVSAIYDSYNTACKNKLLGLRDENGKWATTGHPDRKLHIGQNELKLFATLFDIPDNWKGTKLPAIHTQSYIEVLKAISRQEKVSSLNIDYCASVMWDETNSQNAGIIVKNVHFAEDDLDLIYSGSLIAPGCPIFKTARKQVNSNGDFDNIDLNIITDDYKPRCVYTYGKTLAEYVSSVTNTPWGDSYIDSYRLAMRKMVNLTQERSLMSAIIAPKTAHINGLISATFLNIKDMLILAGETHSLPLDFFVKVMGKTNIYEDTMAKFPLINNPKYSDEIIARVLLLNCLNNSYADLWKEGMQIKNVSWAKTDSRLDSDKFNGLNEAWTWYSPLRSDYERRQALVELDVLVSMSFGMTLEQLKTIYRAQFPVLNSYERDTWYDANGRIAFSAKNYGDLTYKRPEFERNVKNAQGGTKFYRTITDDTMPGGPIERTIEYVAPFERCDREKDYEVAWKFFEEKYGKVGN